MQTKKESQNAIEVLGIDIGGVIIDRANDRTDTSFFGKRYRESAPTPGALEAVARLVAERFGANVFLVSKCGEHVERKTVNWLAHNRFFERTGVPPDHVRFCRERADKAGICASLGVTHFVDDRLEVLAHMPASTRRILFHPTEEEVAAFADRLAEVERVESWEEVLRLLVARP